MPSLQAGPGQAATPTFMPTFGGCDPSAGGTIGAGVCVDRDANKGFEQLFIGMANTATQVLEPGILGLLALGSWVWPLRLAVGKFDTGFCAIWQKKGL